MAKKKKNFYAVARGRKPGIYTDWSGENGAQRQVIRFKGADYKGFVTRGEAESWFKANSSKNGNGKDETQDNKTNKKSIKDRTIIYTDGCSIGNPGHGGYGVLIPNNGKSKEISSGYKLTTNNRMEMMACIAALKSFKKRTLVVIHSDSKYVIDGIEKGRAKNWRKNKWKTSSGQPAKNVDLWIELLEQCDKHDVVFQWVKGHSGVDGNERCDQLANKAAIQEDLLRDRGYEKTVNYK